MMGVIRVEHQSNYTVMSNTHLRDRRLSLRAKGLMSFMLSNASTFEYSVAGLIHLCTEGRDAIRGALVELKECGYLVCTQTRAGGKFSANDYTLYEEPQKSPLTDFPSTVKPTTAKPLTEKPTTENPQQRNNNVISNNINNNTPQSPPKGDGEGEDAETGERIATPSLGMVRNDNDGEKGAAAPLPGEPREAKKRKRREARKAPDYEPEMFARLWARYPRGEDKQSAMDEWDRLRPDHELMNVMSAALKRQIASDEWQRGVGIPYLCRWLSKRRWEDDAGRDGGSRAPALRDETASGWADDPEVL